MMSMPIDEIDILHNGDFMSSDQLDFMVSLNILNSENMRNSENGTVPVLRQILMNQQYIMLHLLRGTSPELYQQTRKQVNEL